MDETLKKALAELGTTFNAAVENQQKAFNALKEQVDADGKKRDAVHDGAIEKIQKELDKFEPLSASIKAAQDKAEADAAERKALKEQVDALETKLNRPSRVEDKQKDEAKVRRDAFFAFARGGIDAVAVDQRKNVMTVSTDTSGGYLAPAEYVADIIKGVVEFSPMRNFVTVRTTSRKEVNIPKRTGLGSASWVGEIETRTETTNPTWGMEEIPTHEMTAEYYVSRANLEDSEFDLEAILREQFTEQFGVLEGQAIISGSGVKQIQGILTAAGYNSVNSGAATSITADGIIDLKYSLKTDYASRASFILNRSTLKAIRKLKDGDGQYLWQAGLADARPNSIDGDSYTEMPDMPSLGAGNKAMAYGDWKRAFILVDRTGMALLRDELTRASAGQVKLLAHRRLGGQVVLAEAYSVMTTSA